MINGVAYIEWPVWGPGNVLERDGTIAHELTHVASMGMLGRSPHSLLEGLAMYEEDSYLRTLGVHLTLGSIAHLYASGGFPSSTIWRTRVTDWGLRNPTAVNLCYEDGQAMSAVIMRAPRRRCRHRAAGEGVQRHARRAPRRRSTARPRCARPSSAGWASRSTRWWPRRTPTRPRTRTDRDYVRIAQSAGASGSVVWRAWKTHVRCWPSWSRSTPSTPAGAGRRGGGRDRAVRGRLAGDPRARGGRVRRRARPA